MARSHKNHHPPRDQRGDAELLGRRLLGVLGDHVSSAHIGMSVRGRSAAMLLAGPQKQTAGVGKQQALENSRRWKTAGVVWSAWVGS